MDNYNHSNSELFYIYDNIAGPALDAESEILSENLNSTLDLFCTCKGICRIETCDCLKTSGCINYIDNKIVNINLQNSLTDQCYPIFECNMNCLCSNECGNRVVQKGPTDDLVVNKCNKGFGLFTNRLINKGTFICIYAGEVITRPEALARHENNILSNEMNYIFCLKEHSNGKIIETIIDPSKFGNIGRYINHSCDPNCIVVPVRIDSPIPKLAIFSCKDLNEGTEITFDYGSCGLKANAIESSENNVLKKCMCGSKLCRQWLPYELY